MIGVIPNSFNSSFINTNQNLNLNHFIYIVIIFIKMVFNFKENIL